MLPNSLCGHAHPHVHTHTPCIHTHIHFLPSQQNRRENWTEKLLEVDPETITRKLWLQVWWEAKH